MVTGLRLDLRILVNSKFTFSQFFRIHFSFSKLDFRINGMSWHKTLFLSLLISCHCAVIDNNKCWPKSTLAVPGKKYKMRQYFVIATWLNLSLYLTPLPLPCQALYPQEVTARNSHTHSQIFFLKVTKILGSLKLTCTKFVHRRAVAHFVFDGQLWTGMEKGAPLSKG